MTTRRRIAAVLLAAGAILLLLGGGLAAWLSMTQPGLDRAIAWLESLDAVGFRVEGARGRLVGPLAVDSFAVTTARVSIVADDVELDHRAAAVLFGRLSVQRLAIGRLDVTVLPAIAPPEETAPRFMPRWLSATLAAVTVRQATLTLPGGEPVALADLSLAADITHRRLEIRDARIVAAPATLAGQLALVASEPLRLEGSIDWALDTEPAMRGTLRGRGDLARLDLAGTLAQPTIAGATATLQNLRLGRDLDFRANIRAEAFELTPWSAGLPFGPLALQLDFRGTLDAFETRGDLRGPGLPDGGLALLAALGLVEGGLDVGALRATWAGGASELTTQGRIGFGGSPTVDLQTAWVGLTWPLAGEPTVTSPKGRLVTTGWPRVGYTLTAEVLAGPAPRVDVTATGAMDRSGIEVFDADLQGDAGAATASAYLGFGSVLPWRLEAEVRGLDLGSFRPALDSRLTFGVAASGTGVGEGAAWAAYLGPLGGRLHDWPVSGTGFVLHHPGRTEFRRFDFDVGSARLAASGQLGETTSLDASFAAEDLSALFPELGGRVEGEFRLRSAGPPLPDRPNLRADVALKGRDLSWQDQRVSTLGLDADIDLSDRESSWLRLRAAGLELAGQELSYTRVSLDGYAREHRVQFRVGAGEQAVDLEGSGSYTEGLYRLTGTRISSSAPALEHWLLESPLQVAVRRDAAQMEETCFILEPRRVCLEGRWSADTGWSASLSTLDYPLEALDVSLPGRPRYEGVFDLAAEARGQPGLPWTGQLRVLLRDAWLSYTTPSGRRERLSFGTTDLRGRALPDRYAVELSSRDSAAMNLEGSAVIARLPDTALRAAPIEGRLTASTRQLGLLPVLVPEIDRAAGSLEADLAVAGTIGEPRASGRIELHDGAIEFYQTNLKVIGVEGRIDLTDRGLALVARGQAGEGSFQANGALQWLERELQGRLSLTGTRLLVADVPEFRVEASPDLEFRIDGEAISVKGTVTVPKARIEPRQLVGAVAVSADERIVGPEAPEQDDLGYQVSTDLRLILGQDVSIDAFGLRGRLEGSLFARTRPGEVAVASGELSIEDGEYRAYNKQLDVERGRLLFAGGPVADPGVDLRAKKDLPGYEVGVIVRGRLRRPELSLYSEPSLPQSQIASLLLVGRTLDSLQAGDRESLGASTSDMMTGGGAMLAGQLGRYIGLDDVAVQTDTSYDASLVLGKFLSPRLYVSYGISLTNAINTFKLRYTIGDNWVISAEAGENAAADVEYTIDR